MNRWVSHRIERPILASIVSCAIVVSVILVPGIFVSYQLAREAGAIAEKVESSSGEATLQEKMAEAPGLGHVVAWMDRLDLQIETETRKFIATYTQDAAGLVHGSLDAVLQFLVAVFILYYLFLDRGTFLQALRELLPLSKAEGDRVFASAADSVHANLYATLITSLIDATGGGLLFWLLGLPAPLLWGVVIFVLSILPVVGAGMVWIPAVVYLALTGRWLAALCLLTWGVVSFIIVDNIVYVRLVGQRMRMHEVPALIAFLGGIAVFGLSGMILGPAILAVTTALLTLWRQRMAGQTTTPNSPQANEIS
jgi:predicted PurR-regulated permease PerM